MNLKDRSQKAMQDACKALDVEITENQQRIVVGVIEAAMADAIRETAAQSGDAVRNCCSHDMDMAHKIAEEIERSQASLIANLSSLR